MMSAINPEQVTAAEEKLLAAVKASDGNMLTRLLHPDLVFHTPDGSVITTQMDLDAHRSGKMSVDYITPSEQVIRIFDDMAIVSVLIDTKGRMLDHPIQGQFRYIRVWKLFGNELMVIGGSCIQI